MSPGANKSDFFVTIHIKYEAFFLLATLKMSSAANLGGLLRAISFHHSVLANV